MNLKQMEYFVCVADEGNISAAAKKLDICQPPLSNQMKLLEEELGTVLFERGRKSILLTAAGKCFLDRARTILELTQDTKREIGQMAESGQATLRIGMISSTETKEMVERIAGFSRERERIHYHISEGNTYELIEGVKNNLLDFALVRMPFPEDGLDCLYQEKQSLMAVGTEEYMQPFGEKLQIEELAESQLIIYRRWEQVLNQLFKKKQPHYVCINDDARTTMVWAECGLGIGIVPYSIARQAKDHHLRMSRIADQQMETQIVLVKNRNCALPKYAMEFWEYYENMTMHLQDTQE